MGQQQIIMIILGVIIVGIAIAVGISMFSEMESYEVSTSLVEVGLVDITTTARSVHNQEVNIWTTTARLNYGKVIYVFSHEELLVDNTFTVRMLRINRNGDREEVYWAQ